GRSPMDVMIVPVLPTALIPQVLTFFHDPRGSSHMGITRVIKAIKRYFWFPHLAQKVCEHIGTCHPCFRSQLRVSWKQDGVQRAAPPRPWHTVCADVVSISSPKGKVLLLTAVCLFSGWPEAYPLRSKSSKEISRALRQFNSRLGPFRILRTDGGREFCGDVEGYLQSIGATHSVTLPYSPVAAIEQLNRTLINKFRTAIYTPAWSLLTFCGVLDDILWGIRSTPSS
ncbi:hypothetical protein FOL47_004925, partial [Perkinsus chesapeaki]